MKPGLLIAFEGIDGTGKTSQIKALASYLRGGGCTVKETREPTDGPYGQKIRALYYDRGQVSLEEELDFFIEDRKTHVKSLIIPALKRGEIVLTDRYYFSTAAYQGAAGGDPTAIFAANAFAPEPDLVLLLTMTAGESIDRIQQLRNDTPNDFEQQDQLQKVADLFASFNQDCIKRIDAARNLQAVHADIKKEVLSLLQRRNHPCCDTL